MSATKEMPYFIKPSLNLDATEKQARYEQAIVEIRANLEGEEQMIMKMATINWCPIPRRAWPVKFRWNFGRKAIPETLRRRHGRPSILLQIIPDSFQLPDLSPTHAMIYG